MKSVFASVLWLVEKSFVSDTVKRTDKEG